MIVPSFHQWQNGVECDLQPSNDEVIIYHRYRKDRLHLFTVCKSCYHTRIDYSVNLSKRLFSFPISIADSRKDSFLNLSSCESTSYSLPFHWYSKRGFDNEVLYFACSGDQMDCLGACPNLSGPKPSSTFDYNPSHYKSCGTNLDFESSIRRQYRQPGG